MGCVKCMLGTPYARSGFNIYLANAVELKTHHATVAQIQWKASKLLSKISAMSEHLKNQQYFTNGNFYFNGFHMGFQRFRAGVAQGRLMYVPLRFVTVIMLYASSFWA